MGISLNKTRQAERQLKLEIGRLKQLKKDRQAEASLNKIGRLKQLK